MAKNTKINRDSVLKHTAIVRTPSDLPFNEVGFVRSAHSYPRHRCDLAAEGFVIQTSERPFDHDARLRMSGCLFQYTLSGEGRFQTLPNGKPVAVPRNTAFLLPLPAPARYWLPKGGTWEFCYLTLDGDMADDLVRVLVRQHGYLWNIPSTHAIINIIRGLHQRILDNRSPNEFESSIIAHRFLMELFNLKNTANTQLSVPVERAIWLMERDYRNAKLDMDRIATEAGCSRYHFSRLFRRETGSSPYAYLLKVRLQRALNLITNTKLPLKQVAFDCGYCNYVYFCSVFTRHTRHTPGMVRRMGEQLNLNEIVAQ